ncbi:MAG: hypothetical protein V4488_14785 [Pseudomonadota bacterium]
MRLITKEELVAVAGGAFSDFEDQPYYNPMGDYVGPFGQADLPATSSEPPVQVVVITSERMTPEEKAEFDNQQTAKATIIDNCAQGSPACIPGLFTLYPNNP